MKGKVCIVTGSNSGIGKETAKALARMGATIVMAVRSRERGESAPSRVVNVSSGMHKTGKMDLDDLQGKGRFKGMEAYANSKLMVTTWTYELATSARA